MKKSSIAVALTSLTLAAGSLNADVLTEGDNLVGGYVGFGFAAWSNAVSFGGNFERGVVDEIFPQFNLGAGALANITNYSWDSASTDYTLTHTLVGGQVNLHYDAGEGNVQPYGGINIGYNNYSDNSGNNYTWSSGITTGGQLGSRYYFADDLAAHVRVMSNTGAGSILSGGVDFRF